MAKRSRTSARTGVLDPTASIPVVGGREDCPCGSGKRYKNCHGRDQARARASAAVVNRPFEGLTSETQWVAMREIISCATAALRLRGEHRDRTVTLVTVLPMAVPALVRADGEVLLGLQTIGPGSGDAARDLGSALAQALGTEPGSTVEDVDTAGPRLQELVDPQAALQVRVHEGFDFWVDDETARTPEVAESLEQANAMAVPTVQMAGVDSAYWVLLPDRVQVRWVLPYDEQPLLAALARLHARGESALGEGSRLLGIFRAHGLLVPVWDLAPGSEADEVEEHAGTFQSRLDAALQDTSILTGDERRALAGLTNRQVTVK